MTNLTLDDIANKLIEYDMLISPDTSVKINISGICIELTVLYVNKTRVVLISIGSSLDMGVCMAHIYSSEFLNEYTKCISSSLLSDGEDGICRINKNNPYAYKLYNQYLKSYRGMLMSLGIDKMDNICDPKVNIEPLDSKIADNALNLNKLEDFYHDIFNNKSYIYENREFYGDSIDIIFIDIISNELDKFCDGILFDILKFEVEGKVDLSEGDGYYWRKSEIEPVCVFGSWYIAFKDSYYSLNGTIEYNTCIVSTEVKGYHNVLDGLVNVWTKQFGLVSDKMPVFTLKTIVYKKSEE